MTRNRVKRGPRATRPFTVTVDWKEYHTRTVTVDAEDEAAARHAAMDQVASAPADPETCYEYDGWETTIEQEQDEEGAA